MLNGADGSESGPGNRDVSGMWPIDELDTETGVNKGEGGWRVRNMACAVRPVDAPHGATQPKVA